MDKHVSYVENIFGSPINSGIGQMANCMSSSIGNAAQTYSAISSMASGITALGSCGGVGHLVHIHPNIPNPVKQPDIV